MEGDASFWINYRKYHRTTSYFEEAKSVPYKLVVVPDKRSIIDTVYNYNYQSIMFGRYKAPPVPGFIVLHSRLTELTSIMYITGWI